MSEEVEIYMDIFTEFGRKSMLEFIKNPDEAAQNFMTFYMNLT